MGVRPYPRFKKLLFDDGFRVEVYAEWEDGTRRAISVNRLGPGVPRLMSVDEINGRVRQAKSVNKTVKACKEWLIAWYLREGKSMQNKAKSA